MRRCHVCPESSGPGLCRQQGGWGPFPSRVFSASGQGGQNAPSWLSPDIPATLLISLLTPTLANSKYLAKRL